MSWWPGKHLLQYVTQSESFDRSAFVRAAPVAFCGLVFRTNNVDNIIVSVYDSTSASGTLLLPEEFIVPGSASLWTMSLDPPLMAWDGIFVKITGSGGRYQVLYDEG